jgi:hypothetical protein
MSHNCNGDTSDVLHRHVNGRIGQREMMHGCSFAFFNRNLKIIVYNSVDM